MRVKNENIDLVQPGKSLDGGGPGVARCCPDDCGALAPSLQLLIHQTRSSTVKGYLTNPPAEVKPGMFANVELVLEVHKGVLVAPESAVLMTPEGAQIVLVEETGEDRTANFIKVALGLRSRGMVEIIPVGAKLSEKAVVVASGTGAIQLFQGAKLDPRPLRKELRVVD